METKKNNNSDGMQNAKTALQRIFYHYKNSQVNGSNKNQHWNYLGFALATARTNHSTKANS